MAISLKELSQFEPGDYVVHIDHGVGRFAGLVRMPNGNSTQEVIKLVYSNDDVVFVSIHSLHKISKYKSKEGEAPRINKLGTGAWEKLKERTKTKIKDIARDLIKLYSQRAQEKGFAYSPDSFMQHELEASFLYEDTPDQLKATVDIKADMERQRPMDRLVCGDVGFGKTEVAIRAAFKAATDGKQVAVLVPTTVLAYQHYRTFTSRLKDMPVRVDYLSRARSAKDTRELIADLKDGKINIIIGTHRLIGKSVKFQDLGLLIIDEEQKFGVSTKEKLRQMKTNVDTLTLTATPIPRTLQFSLMGARDLSVIQTPPPNRYPIQTQVCCFSADVIAEAVSFEMSRNGQVFIVNNRIGNLPDIEALIHKYVPDARVAVGHGQMPPERLEEIMIDFANYDYDVLLSTTIIESGLDIPNANTIIINQAQNIGLSDLHQLRGRVGRSNRRAFCYLIVPPLLSITEDARRRLKAIESFSDLGSGFNIAMQDLDIRGAGNLLGAEQSGFITDMGFETYQKILAEAMEELGVETGIMTKSSNDSYVSDCTIETDQLALIPDTYIDVTAEKIRIYKELDSLTSDKDMENMGKRLEDRFGKMPEELVRLFDIVRIRQLGVKLGFEKIIIKNGVIIAFFISNPLSQYYRSDRFAGILEKVSQHPKLFELKQNDNKLRVFVRNVDGIAKAYAILKKLS